MSYFIWPAFVLAGWLVAYFVWIRPLRAKLIAVVPQIVEAPPLVKITAGGAIDVEPPTLWSKIVAMFEGWKTVGLTFAISVFTTIMQDTTLVDDFQSLPFGTIFRPAVALKIVSALLIIVPIFHMIGKVKAAIATPVVPVGPVGPAPSEFQALLTGAEKAL